MITSYGHIETGQQLVKKMASITFEGYGYVSFAIMSYINKRGTHYEGCSLRNRLLKLCVTPYMTRVKTYFS